MQRSLFDQRDRCRESGKVDKRYRDNEFVRACNFGKDRAARKPAPARDTTQHGGNDTVSSAARTVFIGLCIASAAPLVAAQYEVAAVADGGSIKGKVVFKGTVPLKTVLPTKDKDTCGGPRKDPLVVVGANGEVKDVVVSLKEVKSGKAWPSGKQPTLDQKGCVFTSPLAPTTTSGSLRGPPQVEQ